jgi:FG-GAP-like repeat/Secretion system C-terminal sorting domain
MLRTLIVVIAFMLPVLVAAQDWTEHTVDSDFDYAYSVFAADVDGDGDMDALGASEGDSDITWWENLDGRGLTWSEHTVDGDFDGAIDVHAEDMDGDGDVDVLGAAQFANEITWWENLDGTGLDWSEHVVGGEYNLAHMVYTADVDDDGDVDVLGAARSAEITWWENLDGTGLNWSEHTVDGEFSGACYVHAGDMDGDGDIDVLGAANADDDIIWWENVDGDGLSWSEHTVDGDYNGAYVAHAEDMDGDGDVDVLGAAEHDDDITWWENLDGTGLNWSEHIVDGEFAEPLSAYAEDLDGDGDMDVLGASYEDNVITWWENLDGDGLNWFEHTLDGEYYGAISVYAEDMNGDGFIDVLGTAFNANDITWWAQSGSSVLLTPGSNPVVVTLGDSFDYSVDIAIYLDEPLFGAIWSEAILPNGSTYGPIYDLDFYFGTTTEIHVDGLVLEIPLFAPLGDYEFVLNMGLNSNYAVYSDHFSFTIVEAGTRVASTIDQGWTSYGHERIISSDGPEIHADTPILTDFSLQPVYPNPFNPTTTVTVSLPSAAHLDILVFDVTGRLVTELASGQFSMGTHSLPFDGSNLASGLYFVRATVAGELDQTQKVMLVR